MKKILYSLVALVCSLSMNAQVVKTTKGMKVMKGNTVVATYTIDQADNVVFEESKTGTAKRTGDIDVKWVQLWANGPRFAEYNVGAANNKPEDYGGYYCWGSSISNDKNRAYKGGFDDLSGTDDTATNLWGSNWRMPIDDDFFYLVNNCVVEWTTINGVNGYKFTGKGDYASNSLFLPVAGFSTGTSVCESTNGYYWTSRPNAFRSEALALQLFSKKQYTNYNSRDFGMSVRAVLAR